MRWIRRADAHERWRLRLHDDIAGTLSDSERRHFEAHLETCEECRIEAEGLRALRASLRAMPDVEAPRSFRLTPQMVARREAPAPLRPRQPTWIPRAAQIAAGIAIFGFVSVLAVDLLGGASDGEDDDPAIAASTINETMRSTSGAGGAGATAGSPAGEDSALEGSREGDNSTANGTADNEPPAYEGGNAEASGVTPTETATEFNYESPVPPATGAHATTPTPEADEGTRAQASSDEELQPLPGGQFDQFDPTVAALREEEPDNDKRLIRSIEAVLASVAVGLIVLAVLARPRARS